MKLDLVKTIKRNALSEISVDPKPFQFLPSTKFSLGIFGRETRLISAVGGYKKPNKENRRNPNEQKAGNKPKVGGFHDLSLLLAKRITVRGDICH